MIKHSKVIALILVYLLNSEGLTLTQISRLLCYDLNVSYRTARENYVMPLVEHKILKPIKDFSRFYTLSKEHKKVVSHED
jgi:hypothetical protein